MCRLVQAATIARSVSTRFGGKHKTIGAVGEFDVVAVCSPNVVGRLDQFLVSRLGALSVHLQLSKPAVRDVDGGRRSARCITLY